MTINLIQQDQQQRALALDASQSFIVQAPAGSGKTELLIQRFLTLLAHVTKPEEILAITFTKKAANEMRLRVIKALKQASDPKPESAHAQQTWLLAVNVLERDKQFNWDLISNPNQLRIQTIDALCAFLTKQLPLLSHFGSQPDIADNPKTLYREAVQEVLSHVEEKLEWSQAIALLLLHLDNDLNKLHDLLVNLLAKRDQWLPYIHLETDDSAIRKQLERHLSFVITDNLCTLTELFPKEIISELTAIARFAADQLSASQIESEVSACRHLDGLPGTDPKDVRAWLGLARLLLTKSFSWRKKVDEEIGFPTLKSLKNAQETPLHNSYRQRLTAIITTLNEREDLRQALIELFFLPAPQYQDVQWEILQALLKVLKIVAAQLRLSFQQHGQIDFIENAQAALAALGTDESPTDLALALDYQIRHILVDEFQDTAFTQYQLLEKLTMGWDMSDGRTLFVVGDPMQSIYRFREAEVGLFIRMRKNGIGHIKLKPLTLALNFRSTANIVEWNNQHFKGIFPSYNDIATGAVNYSPSVSFQQNEDPQSLINIKGFIDATDEMQANTIVELVEQTKQHAPNDKIAILVRSRGHLSAIIPALKKAKIPYRAIDIDPLASRQSIQDLLSLTCALLHPSDRIAWLSVLRAPWCGLTLADLLVIAGDNPHATIGEQLERKELIQQLSQDGQQRLSKVIPLLKSRIAERERYPLRDWIESTWLLLGGPACLHDYADIDDANAFFKLLDGFSQTNPILSLDKLKEKINQLFASTQHDDATLQIMTIHTAKGLEFDTVILPHLERKIPTDDKSLLLWMDRPLTNDQIAMLLAPIHATGNDKDAIYEFIQRQHRIKSDFETDRLFYVAATRAKKRLHLFFNSSLNAKNEVKVESGSFLEKLWPFLEKQQEQIILQNPNQSEQQPLTQPQRSIMRLDSSWQNPIAESITTNIATHLDEAGFILSDDQPRLIGTLTHRLLQQIAQFGNSWWEHKSKHEQHSYLNHHLKQLGLLDNQLPHAISMIQKSITNTLTDTRGQWILHSHQAAKSEFALTAIINHQTENLIIDRTFIDDAGTRWIIDYKTTTLTHDDLEVFLKKEQQKYLEKMYKYAQSMRLIEEKPVRLGLYFPALPAWKEWGMEY